MTTFRELLEASEEHYISDLYPMVHKPITKKDLDVLYAHFNKELFSNKLPKCRIKFSTLAKNFAGKAHAKYDAGSYKLNDLLITIATKFKTDPKSIADTMLHEMIHIWQYVMNEKDKTFKYSEATWSEVGASNDKHTYGHNSFFREKMGKFNQMGIYNRH
jgi:hypothetical protein